VNLTSTGWLGWPPANAMLGASVLRAVEGRVGLVRAANTGVSGFVGPDGEITDILLGAEHGRPQMDAGALIARVRISHEPIPFYARWGAWIDPLSFILCIGTLVVGFVWRRFASPPDPVPATAREEQRAS
jgi:apolipoprotein N-acyltransferase